MNEIWVYRLSLTMIIGGAIGNLTDRIRLHYVIDFIHIKVLRFAIFNIADIFIIFGAVLLTYSVLFHGIDI